MTQSNHVRWLMAVLLLATSTSLQTAAADVERVHPPAAGFYGKLDPCGGIAVRAAGTVDDAALVLACGKVRRMLSGMPAAGDNLRQLGAELHVIGRDQRVSDLPEMHAKPEREAERLDQRTRGVGGLLSSCGEENLLALPTDRYHGGSDICTHEFAHAIMGYGFDAAIRSEIAAQYARSIAAGRWVGAYAATNPQEYWAELSTWYFGAHGNRSMTGAQPADGPDGLHRYDPDAFALLDRLYRGREHPARIDVVPAQRLPADRPAHSGSAAVAAQLLIENHTSQTVQLFWIGYDGEPRLFGRLASHDIGNRATFVSHVWQVADDGGHVLARFTVQAPVCRAVIGPD